MNTSKPLNFVLTTVLVLVFSNSSFSQKLEPKERSLEPDHTITSKVLEKEFELFISFPKNYTTKDTINYPVLYVLDGKFTFRAFKGAQQYLSIDGTIEDVIIVGINSNKGGQNGRYNDYTISSDTILDRKMDDYYGLSKGAFKSGGAEKFLESIKTEIVPFVDKNYKTNSNRGISGHSLGGLFTTYCFLNSDGYFTRFGIHSPALSWNNDELLNQAVTEFKNKYDNKIEWDLPPTKVFISVGESEGSAMVPAVLKLSAYLKDLNSDKIDLEWYMFENEKHFSVISASLSRTLSVLYGKE
ncbi:MAG: alpha/beta hydrolase-fold protein [Melioribacteraceae bacterium]